VAARDRAAAELVAETGVGGGTAAPTMATDAGPPTTAAPTTTQEDA
jgi:hypothetical protein